MIILFDDNRDHKLVIKALKLCENLEELEKVFGLFGISDYTKRTMLLNEVMGVSNTDFVGINNYPDAKNKYSLTVDIFIANAWRDDIVLEKANKIINVMKSFED